MTRKWDRVKTLHQKILHLDKFLVDGIARGDLDCVVLYLMRRTGIRVGGNESIKGRLIKDATYGASTLRAKHAKIVPSGDLVIDFIGKKGVRHRHVIDDIFLIRAFKDLLRTRTGNDPLFQEVTNKSTMSYLRNVLQEPELKNHDLRTYIANAVAISEVKKHKPPKTEKEYRFLRNVVGQLVSEKLGNGRYHALNSYINPKVFDIWRRPGWSP